MNITKEERMFGSILNNKQNLERWVILHMVLLHFSGVAVQRGTLEENLGHS